MTGYPALVVKIILCDDLFLIGITFYKSFPASLVIYTSDNKDGNSIWLLCFYGCIVDSESILVINDNATNC